MEGTFLCGLNSAQLKAATYPPNTSLQILAGPGSGKTRVLTSRIAYLILHCHIPPLAICAVTFTNKAANEMKERLTKLIGKEKIAQVKLGTFHSLCARYIRKYPREAKVPDNFTVCDANESKKMIAHSLKNYKDIITQCGFFLEPSACASMISTAKSRGQSAKDYLATALTQADSGSNSLEVVVGRVYVDYEATLRRINALDFDDLLIYGVRLFADNRECSLWCKHILVDEFQDTNVTQYQLMKQLAIAGCVTIVGDPDQSIYGWRSADVKNLGKMRQDFPDTAQIFLEESYRSTVSILEASLTIISQDSKRINKSLHTSHPSGITPTLYQVDNEYEESLFIALEIRRIAASMGGALRWGDFAVLLRFNALSRNIERALQNESIPYRVLGGHKFFERLEVKDMLAYLQLIDNPAFVPAFMRVINVPGRGIGEKTLNDILKRAEESGRLPLEIVEGIYAMKLPDLKPSIRKKISPFVQVIRALRTHANEGLGPSELLTKLVDLVQYREHLKKTQQDWETRMENVNELITFAKEIEMRISKERENARLDVAPEGGDVDADENVSPLRQFLQVSILSSEGDDDNEDNNEKVTITTCHSAKGLEWSVVMIPSVDSTTYPFMRSDDEDEERRLLYVACTRAKAMLYLTRAMSRMVASNVKQKNLSNFIVKVLEKNQRDGKRASFSQRLPQLEVEDREIMCKVLGKNVPDEADVQRMVNDFFKLGKDVPQNIAWRPGSADSPSMEPSYGTANPSSQPPANFEPTFIRPSLQQGNNDGIQAISSSTELYQTQARRFDSLHATSTKTHVNPSKHSVNPSGLMPFSPDEQVSSMKTPTPGPSRLHIAHSAMISVSNENQPQVSEAGLSYHLWSNPTNLSVPSATNQTRLKGTLASKPSRTVSSSVLPRDSAPSAVKQTPLLSYSNTIPPPIPPISSTMYQTEKPRLRLAQAQPPSPLQPVSNQYRTSIPPTSTNTSASANLTGMETSKDAIPIKASEASLAGRKRRLGVGRATTGYTNKKFKPPVIS